VAVAAAAVVAVVEVLLKCMYKSYCFSGNFCAVRNHSPEVKYTVVGVSRKTHQQAPRPDIGCFRVTDDNHVDDVALLVRYGQRQREKWVKRVAMVMTTGTG